MMGDYKGWRIHFLARGAAKVDAKVDFGSSFTPGMCSSRTCGHEEKMSIHRGPFPRCSTAGLSIPSEDGSTRIRKNGTCPCSGEDQVGSFGFAAVSAIITFVIGVAIPTEQAVVLADQTWKVCMLCWVWTLM